MVINHLFFLVKHSLSHLSFSLVLVCPWHWWSKFFLAGSADSAYKVLACHLCTTRVPAIRDGTWCTEIDLGLISRRTILLGSSTLGTLCYTWYTWNTCFTQYKVYSSKFWSRWARTTCAQSQCSVHRPSSKSLRILILIQIRCRMSIPGIPSASTI